jgi:hypothetical protein
MEFVLRRIDRVANARSSRMLKRMCAACALTAMGRGLWSLQAHHSTWLTEQRLRRATVGVFVVATIAGTTKMSGSTAPPEHASADAAQSTAPANTH